MKKIFLSKSTPLYISFVLCIVASVGALLIALGVFGTHAGWIATDGLVVETSIGKNLSYVDYVANTGETIHHVELNSYSPSYVIGVTKVPILYNPSKLTQIVSNSGLTKALPWICFGAFGLVGLGGLGFTIFKNKMKKGNKDEDQEDNL